MKLTFNVNSAILAVSTYSLLGMVGASAGAGAATVSGMMKTLNDNVVKLKEESAKVTEASTPEDKAAIESSMNALVNTCAENLVTLVRDTLKLSFEKDKSNEDLKKYISTQEGLLKLKNFLQMSMKEGKERISDIFDLLKKIILSDPLQQPETKDLHAVLFDANVFSKESIAVFTKIKDQKEAYTLEMFTQECVPVIEKLHELIEKSEKTGAGNLTEELKEQVSSAKTTLWIYIGLNVILLIVAVVLGYSIFKKNKSDEFTDDAVASPGEPARAA